VRYCSYCAEWNAWPKPEGEKSLGYCGYCKRHAVLNPDEATLPPAKKLPKRKKAGILKPDLVLPDKKIIRPD